MDKICPGLENQMEIQEAGAATWTPASCIISLLCLRSILNDFENLP